MQSAPLNNGNNHDNISSENSEVQSFNNTLSATTEDKQKMLLKIANNSISAAVASAADNDYGNVSVSKFLSNWNACMVMTLKAFKTDDIVVPFSREKVIQGSFFE